MRDKGPGRETRAERSGNGKDRAGRGRDPGRAVGASLRASSGTRVAHCVSPAPPADFGTLGTLGLNGKPGMSRASIAPGQMPTFPSLARGTLGEANGNLQGSSPSTEGPKASAQVLACSSRCLWLQSQEKCSALLSQAPVSPNLVKPDSQRTSARSGLSTFYRDKNLGNKKKRSREPTQKFGLPSNAGGVCAGCIQGLGWG